MGFESAPQINSERTELKTEAAPERAKKLKKLRQAIGRFMLAGVVFFGAETVKHNFDESQSTLAEMFELTDQEERDMIFEIVNSSKLENPPEVLHDVEARDGIINRANIEKFLNMLPQNWVKGEVSVVANTEEDNYQPVALWSGYVATFSSESKRVEFQDGAKKESANYLFYALAHEASHANDFLTDSDLTWPERHRLYESVSKRLKSDSHFTTHYVEMLKETSDEGSSADRFALVREYWAEVCAQYFTDPSQLDIEDFELVHEHVLKNAPDYNWKEKLEERQKIFGPGTTEHIVNK